MKSALNGPHRGGYGREWPMLALAGTTRPGRPCKVEGRPGEPGRPSSYCHASPPHAGCAQQIGGTNSTGLEDVDVMASPPVPGHGQGVRSLTYVLYGDQRTINALASQCEVHGSAQGTGPG